MVTATVLASRMFGRIDVRRLDSNSEVPSILEECKRGKGRYSAWKDHRKSTIERKELTSRSIPLIAPPARATFPILTIQSSPIEKTCPSIVICWLGAGPPRAEAAVAWRTDTHLAFI